MGAELGGLWERWGLGVRRPWTHTPETRGVGGGTRVRSGRRPPESRRRLTCRHSTRPLNGVPTSTHFSLRSVLTGSRCRRQRWFFTQGKYLPLCSQDPGVNDRSTHPNSGPRPGVLSLTPTVPGVKGEPLQRVLPRVVEKTSTVLTLRSGTRPRGTTHGVGGVEESLPPVQNNPRARRGTLTSVSGGTPRAPTRRRKWRSVSDSSRVSSAGPLTDVHREA